VLQGNFPGALTTISTAISNAGTALLAAGGYVFNSVIAKASAVINTVVGSLPTLLAATAAQAAVVVATTSAVVTNTITALSLGNIQGAWNAAVDGLLGPSGIPGALLNLSIGAGIQTGPIVTPDAAGIAAVFVPSTRTLVQATVKAITADLQVSPAGAAAAPSASAARSAAATEAAPAAEAAAGDSSAAATGSAPAEKPAAHRAARKAAKAAG
jgi:hypothetical protein